MAISESAEEDEARCGGTLTTLSGIITQSAAITDFLTKYQRAYPLRYFANRHSRHLFQSRGIDDRHQSSSRIRDVDEFAVRSEGNPFGDRAGWSTSGAMNFR